MNQYLEFFGTRSALTPEDFFKKRTPLYPVSAPNDPKGYNDSVISNDIITEVYAEFSEHTRGPECTKYLQTLTGKLEIFLVFGNGS